MDAAFSGLASLAGVLAFIDLDVDGFVFGGEMATILATLLSTIFAGLANALVGQFFNGGA